MTRSPIHRAAEPDLAGIRPLFGGQFNQVVKSGGNQFHGSAYEYLQNRNLNAADNQSAVNGDELHPRYDNNRFGGSLGGPIKKNKIFFYGLYEYNPQGLSATPGSLYAPTANGWATISGIPGISQSNMTQLKTYLGVAPSAVSAASVGGYPLVDRAMRAWDGVRRRQRRRKPWRLARSASMRRPTPTVSPA